MGFLPSLRKDLSPALFQRKSAEMRRATAVQASQYGRPYLSNWDLERAVRDGYDRVPWVFRCVDVIASNAAGLDFVIRKGHHLTGDPIPRHPLLPVLNRQTNHYETSEVFIYRLVSQYLLSKKGVFVEVEYNRSGEPTSLQLLPPHFTFPIPDADTFVSAYRVQTPGQQWIDVPAMDDLVGKPKVLWIKKPHPLDPYSGVTPLESAGLSVDTDYYARIYNRRFLQNDGRPGGILAVKGDLDPEDAEELRRRFNSGPDGAGRTSVIEADEASWIDTATTQRDSQYTDSMKGTRDTILLAFGVPISVMGDSSNRTYSNTDAEKSIFWEETMIPHLRLIAGALDPLDGDPELYTSFDVSAVHVLNRFDQEEEDRLKQLYGAGLITADEFREKTGRDPFDVPGSRALWINSGLQAIAKDEADQEALAPPEPPMPGALPPGADPNAQAALPAAPEQPALPAGPRSYAVPEDWYVREEPTSGPRSYEVPDDWIISGKSVFDAIFSAVDEPETKVLDGLESPGVMVALFLDDSDARQLAVPGGEEPDEMHVTLAYLGKADGVNRDALEQAVAGFALTAPPLVGKVSGYGRFDVGAEHAIYASVDIPDLPEWRQRLIAALEAFGVKVNKEHGLSPHCTIRYCAPNDPDIAMPPRIPVAFDAVTVACGEHRQSFLLKGAQAKSALVRKWTVPA